MLRVLHVISNLGAAGAEMMLYRLVLASRGGALDHSVVSLTDAGVVGPMLAAEGVPVAALGMRRGVPDPRAVVSLVRLIRRQRPNVVQSWMYHADLIAGLACAAAGNIPVVWGIRHADVDPHTSKPTTRITRAMCARLSGALPTRIVCCARAALQSHAGIGYRADRMVVIPNGFDTSRLVVDPAARARLRHELGIPERVPVVGAVTRFHPDKDPRNLLEAVQRAARVHPEILLVLVGQQLDASNATLATWIDELGLRPRIRLLGVRSDVPALLSSFDVLAQSSRTEAFPNVIAEAMACGVPCAVTDCGDAREIVGAAGRVVPTRDAAALAAAIAELLALPATERLALGAAARERVVTSYDIRAVVRRYEALYREVCESCRA